MLIVKEDTMTTNKQLFSGLSRVEKVFIRPDEEPMVAFFRLMIFMQNCERKLYKWPELLFPQFGEALGRNGSERHHGTIVNQGSAHVRGGWGLNSDENTTLKGPLVLGRNVILRKGAVVTGPCWIGDDVVIGHACRIKHSVLLPGANITFGTRVSHALIGRDVHVGSNVVLEDEVPPGMKDDSFAMGLIAGDGCWIGGGAIIAPNVILKPGENVACGEIVRRSSLI